MQKLITPQIAKNYNDLEIDPEDILFILQFLTPTELYRVTVYEHKMGQNLTPKRLFLFICNIIDFSIKKPSKSKKNKKLT